MNDRLTRIIEDTAAPVTAKVTPSLHPDVLLKHGDVCVDGGGGAAEAGWAAARTALKIIYDGTNTMIAARDALLEEVEVGKAASTGKPITQRRVPDNRTVELATLLGNSQSRIAVGVQRAVDIVDASLTDLESKVSAALRNPRADTTSISQEASEIRQYVADLPPGQRVEFIRKQCAIAEALKLEGKSAARQHTIVAAVINYSPWISGMDDAEMDLAQSFARDAFAPRESKQADALRSSRETLTKGSYAFANAYLKLVPTIRDNPKEAAVAALRKAGS